MVRNTLARLAIRDTVFECIHERLVGPLVLAFSQSDPGASARIMRDFAKSNDQLVVKLISFEGRLLEPVDIDVLANLPTREQAIAQLMMLMKAPVTQLVRIFAEPHAKLVRTINAIRQQKKPLLNLNEDLRSWQ